MKAKLTICGRFPGANDYIKAERTNRHMASAMKRKYTDAVCLAAINKRLPAFKEPVFVTVDWWEKNKRRDPDNIRFGIKFVLDGLVRAGVLVNDTQAWILGIEDRYHVDRDNPRVTITLQTGDED